MDVMKTLQKFKDEIEAKGYYVYAIMLKGSQNYNLDDEESDVDANVILIPTITQMLDGGVSTKFEFEEGEVTAHDIYNFAKIVAKGNPQWIEVCHTEYKIGDSLDMFKHFEINPSALKGMAYEKVKAFDKLYPSREHMVKKHGYDPKQLHHIIRLFDLLKSGEPIVSYEGEYRDVMIGIKRGALSKEKAFEMRDEYNKLIIELAEEKKLEYKPQEVDKEKINEIFKIKYKEMGYFDE